MKKLYFTLIAFLFLNVAHAQIINFVDANLKARLLQANPTNGIAINLSGSSCTIDTNNDGEIQVSEAILIKALDVEFGNVSHIGGLGFFSNLEGFSCYESGLTTIDANEFINLKYLNISRNYIQNLDVSSMTNLQSLLCDYNVLINLNVSGLSNLQYLNCNSNQLTTLNLTGLSNLKTLKINNNQISNLNLTGLNLLEDLDCSINLLSSLNLTGLNLLDDLDCSVNQLSSLNVSGLSSLEYLNYSNNQLLSPDLNGLTNLQALLCAYNQLPSLDLNGLTSLLLLDCDGNQLPSLDVSGVPNLKRLSCSYNQLTSLDVITLTNLDFLFCADNQLTELNISTLGNLERLNCQNNQLTILNANGLSKLYQLSIEVNPLTTLLLKNDSIDYLTYGNGFDFSSNTSLEYICANDTLITFFQQKIFDYGFTNCHVNSYCSFTPGGIFYNIQGNNKVDSNNNGCAATDQVSPNLKLDITNGTISGSVMANTSGNYSIPVQAGVYTITPQLENPNYFTISPTSVTVTFPATTSPFIQNFCIVPTGIKYDLEVVVIPIDVARPGFDATYKIKYKNKGNQSENATVNFTYNDAILDYVSSSVSPSTQVTGTLSWAVGTITPFQSGEILVTLNVNSPMETPAVNGGDILSYSATANGLSTDETPDDNTVVLNQIVVNSFDPNDKTCLEGNVINPSMIGKYVHYKIRFENTGTFAAQNIVVKDIIDTTKFDIASLQMTDASHSCITKISNTNKVEFIFENINLPFDDANNDGYVVFKIKTKPTLTLNSTISNLANIYFDYNFPIVTNTATSTFTTLGNDTFEFDNYFTIYPNPVAEVLSIKAKQDTQILGLSIYTILGQLVQTVVNPTSTLDVADLKTDTYFVKITTDKGVSSSKFVKE